METIEEQEIKGHTVSGHKFYSVFMNCSKKRAGTVFNSIAFPYSKNTKC